MEMAQWLKDTSVSPSNKSAISQALTKLQWIEYNGGHKIDMTEGNGFV